MAASAKRVCWVEAPPGEERQRDPQPVAERGPVAGGAFSCTPEALRAFTEEIRRSCSDRAGSVSTHGRFHELPRRLEHDYEVDRGVVLGTGMSGGVNLGLSRDAAAHVDGQPPTRWKVAVKTFRLQDLPDEEWQDLLQEVSVSLMMDHPNVARLYDVYVAEEEIHLVMECMEGGELVSRHRREFSEHDARDATWQMVLGLMYMHSKGVVHRDLKPQNFLFQDKSSRHIKLIDFGLSKFASSSEAMSGTCGSVPFMAPEVWGNSYDSCCDLWSLGVIIFLLLVGHLPFNTKSDEIEAWAEVIRHGRYRIPAEAQRRLSCHSIDFVKRLLVVKPAGRMRLTEAIAHPWLEVFSHERRHTVEADVIEDMISFANMPKFKRACYHLMVWSLSAEVRKKLRPLFLQMDEDHDGTICAAELRRVIQQDWDMADSDLDLIFQAIDENNDGEIRWSEFLAVFTPRYVNGDEEMMRSAFRRFDEDHSGVIRAEELRNILGADAPVDDMMSVIDLNGDGEISFDELMAFCTHEGGEDEHCFGQRSATLLETGRAWTQSQQEPIAKPPPKVGLWSWWDCCSVREDKNDTRSR